MYRGPALLLADGLEIPVQAELTGNVPEVGLPGWTGMLESGDTRFSAGAVRFGRLRLPDGWEGGFAVMRRLLGVSTVWVRGNDVEASPADWPDATRQQQAETGDAGR
ncbi:hypothetical protein KSE_01810 [Kitasatospora setae KM-6054]|uniref:Uncharacterized protein n=1 Tax=Kitasatospora setae (strain ATCC 33774 / DSM 43861 / JCM 3304 / KCC A-0304 / NBRC 14216 / KM-6054) TaxID=452652 RepID=E4N4A1_KITSK|nr:hypothetical protein KSE_01810 [Kitasatospora setae KM-6054]